MWIDPKLRLPDEDQAVLLWTYKGYISGYWSPDTNSWICYGDRMELFRGDIRFWCPLQQLSSE